MTTELHPLGFFLPENTRLLMLGSFPPPRARWSMDFYYPNIQNDMWRILGLIFYGNKDAFLRDKKAFSEEKAKAFCREKGIGIGDTAMEVIRRKRMPPISSLRWYGRSIRKRSCPRYRNAWRSW